MSSLDLIANVPIYEIEIYDEFHSVGMSIVIDTDHEEFDEHNMGTVLKAALAAIEKHKEDEFRALL